MARRGVTIRAAQLSDLLEVSGVGTFPGTESILVTTRNKVYRVEAVGPKDSLLKKRLNSGVVSELPDVPQLGNMVRSREMEFPRYLLLANEETGELTIDRLDD